MPSGDVGPRNDRQVEFATVLLQVVRDRVIVRREADLDADTCRSSRYGVKIVVLSGNSVM